MVTYTAKVPDQDGLIEWTNEENKTWQTLFERQIKIIENRACDEFVEGVHKLKMPTDRIPQIPELNEALNRETGWSVKSVPALIPVQEFFNLLANKQFPAATFIRVPEELDYLQEPDLFHEYFGHCPLLTNQVYADFMEWYGKLALEASEDEQNLLARLFWFTIEFGLIDTPKGMHIYGGGILSSKGETVYSLESDEVKRKPFVLADVLRTPYRIDIMQPIYYCINSFEDLYEFKGEALMDAVDIAVNEGDFSPSFVLC